MKRGSALLAALVLATPAMSVAAGSLYREGRTLDGGSVQATVGGGARISGTGAACAGCHGRSGLGRPEGQVRPLPITAALLFSPRTTIPRRPAYDDATVLRAITSGIAADGRVLDPLMPRYTLSRADQGQLLADLHELGAMASPGVTAEQMTLATIVAERAPAREREAIGAVLAEFVGQHNSGTRHEDRRAEQARRHPFGERRDRAYRRWHLLEWTLRGAPSTWTAQLETLYDAQTPFAIVSGTTGGDWDVVARFCESRHVPCVLPLADQASAGSADFYNLYYSDGPRLEARVTARHLVSRLVDPQARISVVRRDDARSREAMVALVAALAAAGHAAPREILIGPRQRMRTADWRELVVTPADALVAWVDAASIGSLLEHRWPDRTGRPLIYTAESFTDWRQVPVGRGDIDIALHVYPYRLANAAEDPFPRETAWLRSRGLLDLDGRAAGRALFACHAFGEALGAMENNFSREYLLETLEHMLDDTGMTSIFPRTALGQGQRVLARGAYVAAPSAVLAATAQGTTWVDL